MEYLKPFSTSAEGYRIELAKKIRLKEILQIFRDNYYEEETLGKSLRSSAGDISEEELALILEDEDNMITAVYESSPCLIAIHNDTNKTVGVILTVLSQRSDEDEASADGAASAILFDANTFKSNLVKDYYGYLSKIDKHVGILNRYPDVEAAMELFAVVVDKEHRQKGLSKDLSKIAATMAKHIPGVGIIYGVFTSSYSKKVAEDIGMQSILEFDLEEHFKNEDGDPVFSDLEPDNIVSVMGLEVVQESNEVEDE